MARKAEAMSAPTPDDLVRGASTLRDEATMLDLNLRNSSAPALSYGMQNLTLRRDSLRRTADYLMEQAKRLHAVPA